MVSGREKDTIVLEGETVYMYHTDFVDGHAVKFREAGTNRTAEEIK